MLNLTSVRILRQPLALAVLALAALLPGCRRHAIGTDVVATIEGEEMRYSEFEAYLRDNVDSSDLPLDRDVLEKLFDQFLDERLLGRLAVERGLTGVERGPDGEPRVDHRRAITYLLHQARPRPPGDAEIAAYYAAHREDYRRSESVRLNQILVHERENAVAARQALLAGEKFEDVAARYSQVPIAHLGDGGGRLTRDDLPEAFADAIFELEPGEVSDIFAADYGFHLFQVVERVPADEVPLEEVVGEIRRLLERQRLDDLVASFLDEARRRYNVEVHPANFPFDYRGSYVREEHPTRDELP